MIQLCPVGVSKHQYSQFLFSTSSLFSCHCRTHDGYTTRRTAPSTSSTDCCSRQSTLGTASVVDEEIGHLRQSLDASRLMAHFTTGQQPGSLDGLQPLRRARSKSVLVPPTVPRYSMTRRSPRGSLQNDVKNHKVCLSGSSKTGRG